LCHGLRYLSKGQPSLLPPKPLHITMRYPRPMARILNSVRLFSFSVFSFWSSQSESTAYLSPFSNSPPVPVIDNDLPYERYSEAVRRLRPLFSPTCPLFEPGEVTVIGDTPIAAGGFADIWKGTRGYGRDSHNVIQKTYRCYEICDVERTFRVRNQHSSHTPWFTFHFRGSSARCGYSHNSPTPTLPDSSESIQLQTTLSPSFSIPAAISASESTSTSTLKSTG